MHRLHAAYVVPAVALRQFVTKDRQTCLALALDAVSAHGDVKPGRAFFLP